MDFPSRRSLNQDGRTHTQRDAVAWEEARLDIFSVGVFVWSLLSPLSTKPAWRLVREGVVSCVLSGTWYTVLVAFPRCEKLPYTNSKYFVPPPKKKQKTRVQQAVLLKILIG